ncbi:myosin light chain kinase, smooth muscle-like isoform X2 [Xenia sp. Carnegie-2017]|uniref:myosin light chain kinase, smooth muscle-like isoform X2 n=1 Tax=Xenia sp. Carnegie-2017 TaxID=2897299 RepID=UPI001F047E9F|nr:myosin light chain kinase, smooth muscle-like isoform X2 [Xenia sp. Carnegie-2017]XP_046864996.1 myosin light chain kinase, smooth muscle-like isoform X2 [Xenia sp. Carnegie-2017]XP_046864997.1 myosin light chain kinase, smooth muscle-like isoform X2 [Xenia sp. Carnegie-2017]XP_046864998.1 myosin light chain kinase, smooth muscle-like isoform X2 [Xenia sp. Carnegie-2017]
MMNNEKEDHFNATGPTTRPPIVIRQSNLEDDYTICEELGRGKFGFVKRIKRISTNEQFAAKWIKINEKTKNNVLEEIKIMEKLDSKRVIKLHNVYETSKSYILVMEFVTGGELFERIASEETVTEKECVHYMRQLLEGLQYIHRMNIVHLDLKPENIVCVSKYSWNIKLIDFGLAKELKPGTIVKTMQGTPEFVAPEIINYDPIHLASDMWSVGVIAYILVSGLSPFLGDDDNDTLTNVTAGTYDFEDEAFMNVGHEVKDFIEKLLQKSPRKRKTAEECLKHEWIKKNKGKGRIPTENLRKFIVQKKWQKSVNAVRAVHKFSSINSLSNIGAKTKSQSVLKLNVEATFSAKPRPLSDRNRDLSRSVPSVFSIDEGQFNKRHDDFRE